MIKKISPQNYPGWALVTGATKGIGLSMAHYLAARGFSVICVARNSEDLEKLAIELSAKYQVKSIFFALDLALEESCLKLVNCTLEYEISFLALNAGVTHYDFFLDKKWHEQIKNTCSLNVVSPLYLTYLFGQKMRQRKNGAIVLTSSNTAYQPMPFLAEYAASKAFLLSFGEALNEELKQHNIDVLVICPGATLTPGVFESPDIDYRKFKVDFQTPDQVVNEGLSFFGHKPSHVTGFKNRFLIWLCIFLPKQMILKDISKRIKTALKKSA